MAKCTATWTKWVDAGSLRTDRNVRKVATSKCRDLAHRVRPGRCLIGTAGAEQFVRVAGGNHWRTEPRAVTRLASQDRVRNLSAPARTYIETGWPPWNGDEHASSARCGPQRRETHRPPPIGSQGVNGGGLNELNRSAGLPTRPTPPAAGVAAMRPRAAVRKLNEGSRERGVYTKLSSWTAGGQQLAFLLNRVIARYRNSLCITTV